MTTTKDGDGAEDNDDELYRTNEGGDDEGLEDEDVKKKKISWFWLVFSF